MTQVINTNVSTLTSRAALSRSMVYSQLNFAAEPCYPTDITKKIRIGAQLVQNHIITEEQLMTALADQKKTGRQLGRTLIKLNFLTETELLNFLSQQLNIPFLDISQYPRKQEVTKLLPETAARRFRVLLLENNELDVLLAMADPTDLMSLDELGRILKKSINPAVVREGDLLIAIDQSYRVLS